jgi:Pentapeptide repeats (8 copies)
MEKAEQLQGSGGPLPREPGRANLTMARLLEADFYQAKLSGATLLGENLTGANLIETDLTGTVLTGCRVYGIAAWNLKLDGATREDLIITRDNEPKITVDNVEVAQFIYLLLNNEKVRHVIDTITSKVVLILGRFTEERKAVLDTLREELRRRDYLPVLFDFDKPASKDLTGTVQTLANHGPVHHRRSHGPEQCSA